MSISYRRAMRASLAAFATTAALACGSHADARPMELIAAASPAQNAQFDLVMPIRDDAGLQRLLAAQHDPSSPDFHKWLTPAQFDTRFGPDPQRVAALTANLRARGLSVVQTGRVLAVSGRSDLVQRLVGSRLAIGRTEAGNRRVFATQSVRLPDEIQAFGATVIGLSRDIHMAHPFSHRVHVPSVIATPQNRKSTTGGYWYDDLKQAYQYPSYQTMVAVNGVTKRLDGTGVTIAILMSADVLDSDIQAVFDHEHFTTNSGQASDPKLYARVMVDGGSNTSSGAFDEASLDVQEALTGAPGSHVMLYEIPELSDQDIMDGYNRIVSDNKADIVSSSFGACELSYKGAYNNGTSYLATLSEEHVIFLQGNAQGISFLASSGDEAGLECPDTNYAVNGQDGKYVPSVSTPAADPNVTAVGGTNIVTSYEANSLNSNYLRENAYGDPVQPSDPYNQGATLSGGYWGAGGGVSTIYTRPAYQKNAGINTGSPRYRAIPDVGMQVGGCPGSAVTPCNGGNSSEDGNGNTERSYVYVSVNGQFAGLIGTSVASPEFAGATALLVETKGRMGNLNTYLYQLGQDQTKGGSTAASTVFHRGLPGYNGNVTTTTPAQTGGAYYNYEVGNGTPIVYRYIGQPSATPAGAPQTASNP